MDKDKIVNKIRQHVIKNNGNWDLTNDNGDPMFGLEFNNGEITNIEELFLNSDNEVYFNVAIPISYLDKDKLIEILESM